MEFLQSIDLSETDRFIEFFKDPLVEAITLMPRPPKANQLKEDTLLNGHFQGYCLKYDIPYYFQQEEKGQIHFHGLMRFPDKRTRTNFVKWYNRAYGKFYSSDKINGDTWYKYVHKDIPEEQVEYIEVDAL